jgi:hypothetical protein
MADPKTEHAGALLTPGLLFLAVGLVVSTFLAASAWERVKTRPPERTITVTGSAKKRILSDQIEWSAEVLTQNLDRTAAYQALAADTKRATEYLAAQGVKADELRVGAVAVEERNETEYVGTGLERVEHTVFKGFVARRGLTVRSGDVARIEKVSSDITSLLEQGVNITSYAPNYYYTRIGELKIEMLAEASADARARAAKILEKAGGAAIGKLRAADMGVININPANSTSTSWDGNNDTSSLEKDILTIVHVTFELE